jgi:hypothetical protein
MEIDMNHTDILTQSVLTLRDRDAQYGSMQETMTRACQLFEMITGSPLSPYHANIFMHALKLARVRSSPGKLDNYIDGINYLAFAGEFAVPPGSAEALVNAGMRDLVEQMNTQEG